MRQRTPSGRRRSSRIGALRDRLVAGLVDGPAAVRETVPPAAKVAGSAHVLLEGVESEALLFLLDQAGVCASAASACASGAMEPSHVLGAMGVDRGGSRGALRLTPRPHDDRRRRRPRRSSW